MEEHHHYTHRKKRFEAMEPNTKLLMEELMKQVHEDIKEGFKEGFAVQTDIINQRFSSLAAED
jgi:hypothetical protein